MAGAATHKRLARSTVTRQVSLDGTTTPIALAPLAWSRVGVSFVDIPSLFSVAPFLSRLGLDALFPMGTASFWREFLCRVAFDEDVLERVFDLRCLAAEILRVDDTDRTLMAPKLSAKSDALAVFRVRAVAAQIGWLETSLSAAAVGALCNVEMLLASRYSVRSTSIYHQLLLLLAWEYGLLATWETPDALICVPRRNRPNLNASSLANLPEEFVTCLLH